MYIIVNPTARHGLAKATSETVLKELSRRGVRHTVLRTERAGHATDIVREIFSSAADDVPVICVIGGDGTLSEIINGIMEQDKPYKLGIIPAGTGNDLSKALGVPLGPIEAVDTLLEGNTRLIDVGVAGDRYFVNISGVGFDVAALKFTEHFKRFCSGIFPYLLGVMNALFRFRSVGIEMNVDGVLVSREVFFTSIANGNYFGGGMKCAPDAVMDDGLFDVIIVDRIPFWTALLSLKKFVSGKHLDFSFVHVLRGREITLKVSGGWFQFDGEIVDLSGKGGVVRFGILHRSLNIIAPGN